MNADQISVRNNVDFFDNTCSKWMKGVAILLVIACHSITFLSHLGTWGVSLFLLVSGFGLTQAFLKKGLDHFFQKRLSKVLLPYTLITAVWILIDKLFLSKSYSFFTILLSLIGFDIKSSVDVTMWYITFILSWYIVFYLFFKLTSNRKISVLLLFLFSILIFLFHDYYANQYVLMYIFTFPVGVVLGLLYKRLCMMKTKNLYRLLLLTSFISVLFVSVSFHFTNINNLISQILWIFENLAFALGCASIFSLVLLIRPKFRVLAFFGDISYELYLFEGAILWKYPFFIFRLPIPYKFQLLIYFIVIIILSFLLQKLMNQLRRLAHI
jgi:Protein involved in polysaccharide intercellular adhesin (PIA) synthesis/biofilm formation